MSVTENRSKRAVSDEPLVFDPDAIYTKRALEKLLVGVLSLDRFLERVQPPQIFKGCYRGADLIRAVATCQTLDDISQSGPRGSETAGLDSTISNRKASATAPRRGCPPGLEPISPAQIK